MKIYLDESGFTGEDLMNQDQPIFTLASTSLSDSVASVLKDLVFSRVKANELKHSSLIKRPSGREMVIDLVKRLQRYSSRFAVYVVHKEFCTLAKLVDLWVESAMHAAGVDLYAKGGNIAFANVSYLCLRTFESPQFLRKHLTRFQQMMRKRDEASYVAFWSELHHDRMRVKRRESLRFLDAFLSAEHSLGPRYLLGLPQRCLDVTFTIALQMVAHWSRKAKGNLTIIHDRSSNMAKEQWLWDALVAPTVPTALVGFDERTIKYPLRVENTHFVDSTAHAQLQLCDVIAGATALWARRPKTSELALYAQGLQDAGIANFLIGGIWPTSDIRPKKSSAYLVPADPFKFMGRIYRQALEKKENV